MPRKKKTKPEMILEPGHPLKEQFEKTDQSLRSYLELAFQHMGRVPVDNSLRKKH